MGVIIWTICLMLFVGVQANSTPAVTTETDDVTPYTTQVSSAEMEIQRRSGFKWPDWFLHWGKVMARASTFRGWMSRILPPFSLILNCFTLLVFLQKHRRKQSLSLVMTALAIADVFALTFDWSYLVGYSSGFHLVNNAVWCEIVYYLTYAGRTCSSWFILVFTIERFIAVKFPLKRASLLTCTRMKIIIGVVTACCCLSQVYFLVLMENRLIINSHQCRIDLQYSQKYYTKVKFIMREIMGFIVPALATAVLNTWIIILLKKWVHKRMELSSNGAATQRRQNEDKNQDGSNIRSQTIMLVTVSSFSVLIYGPYSCLQVYTGQSISNISSGPTTYLLLTLEFYLQGFAILNHTMNFCFYCLAGRQFRNDFIRAVTCGRVMPGDRQKMYSTKLTTVSSGEAKHSTVTTETKY